MADASRDQNNIPTLLGVSNVDGVTPVKIYADPVTHRLLVDSGGGGGGGTVTQVSVVTANGFAGTVANDTTTPAITLTTTVTGILKGNGTAISMAVANTDYQVPITLTTTGTSGAATFNGTTLNIPQYAGGVSSVSGTTNRVTVSPTTGATVVDIAATYVGQTSITTLGTITTGTWNGAIISGQYGGTGVANTGKTITVSGNTTIGSNTDTVAFTTTGNTAVTLPTSGTLVNTAVTTLSSLSSVGTITTGVWNATDIAVADGGTGQSSLTAYAPLFGGTTSTGAVQSGTVGTAGQVLTSNGAGALPTFQSAPGSGVGVSPLVAITTTSFEDINRFILSNNGGSSTLPLGFGLLLDTSSSATRAAGILWNVSGTAGTNENLFLGNPVFSCRINPSFASTTGSSFFGIGQVTKNGSGHTYTTHHVGFKILRSGGNTQLFATQGDGTTENASSALTTFGGPNDSLEVVCQSNGTTSATYYWRVNGGSWSAPTTLTGNMPSATNIYIQLSVSNNGTSGQNTAYIGSAHYSR